MLESIELSVRKSLVAFRPGAPTAASTISMVTSTWLSAATARIVSRAPGCGSNATTFPAGPTSCAASTEKKPILAPTSMKTSPGASSRFSVRTSAGSYSTP